MFAFGASSIVAAVGGVPDMNGLSAVFTDSVNLRTLAGTTKFNALGTGHSAQFIHANRDVKSYWDKIKAEIE